MSGLLGLMFVGMVETGRLADGRPHAQDRIHRLEVQPQGVAADVAGINAPRRRFLDGKKTGPVRAARAKGRGRRPGAGVSAGIDRLRTGKIGQQRLDFLGQQFSHPRNHAVQFALDAMAVGQLHLDDAGGLFYHQHLVIGVQQQTDKGGVQRKWLAYLEKWQAVPQVQILQGLRRIGGGHTRRPRRGGQWPADCAGRARSPGMQRCGPASLPVPGEADSEIWALPPSARDLS
jgi:hypothetical protein